MVDIFSSEITAGNRAEDDNVHRPYMAVGDDVITEGMTS